MKLKMPGNYLFEYAVIRVMPKVEREEFVNIGVILYCPLLKYLGTKFELPVERLKAFGCELELDELKEHLTVFEAISKGEVMGGPIAKLDLPGRFRWLTAKRSTVLQSSPVHPGLCDDPAIKLGQLFGQLVLLPKG